MFTKKLSALEIGELTVAICQDYYSKIASGCPPENDLLGRAKYLINARSQVLGMEFYAKNLDIKFSKMGELALPVTALLGEFEKMIEFNLSKMSDEQLETFENSCS